MATNKHAIIRYHALDKCFSNLLQALVPKGLAIPFHLTFFVYNDGKLLKENMEKVISEIHGLKLGSRIEVSIIAHDSKEMTHDRMILTNYHLITSGHGFGVIGDRGVTYNAQGEVVSTFYGIDHRPAIYSLKNRHSHNLTWVKDIYNKEDRENISCRAFEVGDNFRNRLLTK